MIVSPLKTMIDNKRDKEFADGAIGHDLGASSTLPIEIMLPQDFLKPEVRSGYVVETKLKKIWAVELDLLKRFTELCLKNDIHFQIFAGTLLGAVRHKGFIPWDDDVDVCMDRDNFKKLLKIADKFSTYPYFLQTPNNDLKFYTPYIRFRNSLTTAIIRNNNSPLYNNGIYIDVFVMDGLPVGFMQRIHAKIVKWCKRTVEYKLNSGGRNSKRIAGKLFQLIERGLTLRQCIWLHQHALGLATPFVSRISMQTHSERFSTRYWLYKNELHDTEMVDFEGIKVPAPKQYDAILRRLYGDYRQLPPTDERGKWHEGEIFFDPDTPYAKVFEKGLL